MKSCWRAFLADADLPSREHLSVQLVEPVLGVSVFRIAYPPTRCEAPLLEPRKSLKLIGANILVEETDTPPCP